MKRLKAVFSVLLSLILALSSIPLIQAGSSELSESPLKISISSNKDTYGATNTMSFVATITNTSDTTVFNISAETLLDSLSPIGRKSEINKSISALSAGESITLKFKTVVDPDSSDLNFFQKILVKITQFFNGKPKSSGSSSEDNRICSEATKIIRAGKKDYTVGIKVWYTDPFESFEVTRGEWIQYLAEKMQMNLSVSLGDIDHYFADSYGSPYEVAIEVANAYGILPPPDIEDLEQDVPMFYPDNYATREFAVYTAVKALGFDGTHNFDISHLDDYSDISYIDEVAIAMGYNFVSVVNNRFNVNSPLTVGEIRTIFKAIDEINNSTIVSPQEEHDSSVLKSDIIKDELSSITNYTVSETDNSYTVNLPRNAVTSTLTRGQIIVLPANEYFVAGVAFKITNISVSESFVILKCTKPELEEVYESIDIAENGTALVNEITTSENVTVKYNENLRSGVNRGVNSARDIDVSGSVPFPGSLTFELANKQISENLKASGEIKVEIPKISCVFKADTGFLKLKIKEFTFTISEKVNIDTSLKYTIAESGYELTNDLGNTRWEAGRIEIGRIPIAIGTTGLSFDFVLFFNVEAKGTVSISYEINSTQGCQYKNGTFRFIFDYDDDLGFLELKGSAKAGIGLSGLLNAFSLMDIIGYAAEGGVAFNASFTPHVLATDTLLCCDTTLYPYFSSGIDQETAVGLFLKEVCKYTLEFEHLKNDDKNPFKLKLHIENGKRVPECTFGTGTISGGVSCFETREPVGNARVAIYNSETPSDRNLVRMLYTNSQGEYNVDNLGEGKYTIVVSATGYFTYTISVDVKKNETTYVENLLMIDRNNSLLSVNGTIVDAVTGYEVDGVSYVVRKGWNNLTGEIIASGEFAYGYYTLNLNSGNYTIQVSKNGYITTHSNIAVSENGATGMNIAISPIGYNTDGDSLRIVLTWGEYPYDLDSHLFGPTETNEIFHTAYFDKNYYDQQGNLIADLDLDDTDSYGPETTTIHNLKSAGVYSFYVQDYTNLYEKDSKDMSYSGARVQVYSGSNRIATFNVPTNKIGNVWHVFDYDAGTNSIIPVNTFSGTNDTDTLRGTLKPNINNYREEMAIQTIIQGIRDNAK